MGLSQFGIWHPSYGAAVDMLDYLTDSYVRRLRWEHEQLSIAVVNALATAMNPKDDKKEATPAFLASIGIGRA